MTNIGSDEWMREQGFREMTAEEAEKARPYFTCEDILPSRQAEQEVLDILDQP